MHSNNARTATLNDGKRVLIVEDDEDVARANKRALERYGWEVDIAADVETASAKLVAQRADVVLCDINLPGQSGVTLLDFVRLCDIDVPVILVTGYPSIQTAIDAVELGASEYLVKPIAPDVLHARLERACDQHRARNEREQGQHKGHDARGPGRERLTCQQRREGQEGEAKY